MDWNTWRVVEEHLVRTNVRPILAIVPDNRDPQLQVGPPEPQFWKRVRGWQDRGWTLALHGYQHLYTTKDGGLLGLHGRSEFAGLPREKQFARLRQGLAILDSEGIAPRAWVAPGHSFDATTLSLLREMGFTVVSDGFTLRPFTDALGLTWIPQQLWGLKPRPFGVWTSCYHTNEFGRESLKEFIVTLNRFQAAITSVPDLLQEFQGRSPTWADFTVAWALRQNFMWRRRAARALRRRASAGVHSIGAS